MAKYKTIKIGALNITTHPHSPEMYVKMFQKVSTLKLPVNYWGNNFAKIGSLHYFNDKKEEAGLYGYIRRFLDFDKNKPWINLIEDKEAEKKELDEIKLPDHLKPQYTSARFIFYPIIHHIFFESLTEDGEYFSPNTVKKIFDKFFNKRPIRDMFEEINVIVSPSSESLDRIFKLPNLRKLEININRPNPDDLDAEEDKIFKKLDNQNAKKQEFVLTAIPKEGIVPDKDTKILARVAANNGSVMATGYDAEEQRVFISTEDHPWEHTVQYNPDLHPGLDVFKNTVLEVAPKFTRRLKK